MMTTTEILNEIYKLPLKEQTNIKKTLLEKTETSNEVLKQELWQKLFDEGLITHIPSGISDEDDDLNRLKLKANRFLKR